MLLEALPQRAARRSLSAWAASENTPNEAIATATGPAGSRSRPCVQNSAADPAAQARLAASIVRAAFSGRSQIVSAAAKIASAIVAAASIGRTCAGVVGNGTAQQHFDRIRLNLNGAASRPRLR